MDGQRLVYQFVDVPKDIVDIGSAENNTAASHTSVQANNAVPLNANLAANAAAAVLGQQFDFSSLKSYYQ